MTIPELERAIRLLFRAAREDPASVDSPSELQQAATSVRAHLQTRAKPDLAWLSGRRPARTSMLSAEKAEEVCEHRFHFDTRTILLGPEIDWTADHTGDEEWRNNLNRHKYWSTLGEAHCRTGNPKYAREFTSQLRSWRTQNPVPSTWDGDDLAWRPFEAGIRCLSWLEALHLFLPSQDLDAEDISWIVISLAEHANFLLANRTARNHRVKEAFGLFALGVLLPELPGASEWLARGQERLSDVVREQILPDGAHYELSPMYQQIVCRQFLKIVRLSKRADVRWPEAFMLTISRMFDYLLQLTKPDGTLPQFNDGDATDARPLLRRAAKVLGKPSLDPFSAVEHQPAVTSWRSPWSGVAVMRSSWGEDGQYLAFDAGPLGAGHQHEDCLSVELSALGYPLLRNSGRFTYVPGPWRDYFVGTHGHNSATVDGHGQTRASQPRSAWMDVPDQSEWFESPNVVFARGTYSKDYGPIDDVTHTRSILYQVGHHWLVYDLFSSPNPHEYAVHFHLADDLPGAEVETDGTRVVLRQSDGAGLLIQPLAQTDWHVELLRGADSPIAGWYSPTYNVRKAVTRASYTAVSRGPAAFAAVLVPFKKDQEATAAVEAVGATARQRPVPLLDAIGCEVSLAGSRRFDAIRGLSQRASITVGSFTLKGRGLAAALEGNSGALHSPTLIPVRASPVSPSRFATKR